MREQRAFCEAVVAELVARFPGWPVGSFTTNAGTVGLGQVVTVTMPAQIARVLLDGGDRTLPKPPPQVTRPTSSDSFRRRDHT